MAAKFCCITFIVSFVVALFILTPSIIFLDAEPGISAFYRRALSVSDDSKSNNGRHPIFTLMKDQNNGLHSHDNITSNDIIEDSGPSKLNQTQNTNNVSSATKEDNSTVSNIMMTPVSNVKPETPKIDLISDIHDASETIVKDLGLGWDSKLARVAQVFFGLFIYFMIMVIKGFIISWGLGQVEKQVSDFSKQDNNKLDVLSNLVNMAVNNFGDKFSS